MSLTSINPNSQPSSLDLLATDNTNLTGFINTSDKPLTVSITAEGKWSLLKPDFATSDPSIIKYKTPVDGDGLPREKSDEKFNFKYPKFNTAALVAEVKDAKGNLKSSVAGKKQTIELLPGESVSFTINDDTAYFNDNAGQLTISYALIPTVILGLYSTGVVNARSKTHAGKVLPDGRFPDLNYEVISPRMPKGLAMATPANELPSSWVKNSTTSRWIGLNSLSSIGSIGDYIYKTTFTLPAFSNVSIVGEVVADDMVTDILINGVSTGISTPANSCDKMTKFSISSGFVVGINSLEFKVKNTNSNGGSTGLRVDILTRVYVPQNSKT